MEKLSKKSTMERPMTHILAWFGIMALWIVVAKLLLKLTKKQ